MDYIHDMIVRFGQELRFSCSLREKHIPSKDETSVRLRSRDQKFNKIFFIYAIRLRSWEIVLKQ